MITCKRPAYTRLSLSCLCETVPPEAKITVWDNDSGPEMKPVLDAFQNHPRVEQIIYNKTNDKLRGPTNWFWNHSADADFLSKVDDDCLMPPGWCETLVRAHRDIPEAGVLGCWRFLPEDFQPQAASRKIQSFGRHQILRNCWVEGSGYLMKRSVIDKIGFLSASESFTNFCIRAAAAGFINGWYYPFLNQEHMDDPRVPHTAIKTDEDFQRLRPLSAETFNIQSREDWIKRLKYSAWNLQSCSFNPRDYLGWRASLRRKIERLARWRSRAPRI
ncbi:MAG: glycosyltransferase [Verrucomicrobia bacterium]|nr:glycosyltransferase [Verrucomicrobiota bacterium]MDE3098021.1 glycosyltransferase [Verrucomicrobiota bacterium]